MLAVLKDLDSRLSPAVTKPLGVGFGNTTPYAPSSKGGWSWSPSSSGGYSQWVGSVVVSGAVVTPKRGFSLDVYPNQPIKITCYSDWQGSSEAEVAYYPESTFAKPEDSEWQMS